MVRGFAGRRQPAFRFALISMLALLMAVSCLQAHAQSAPPRSIDDLLKVLDHYKPDPKIAEQARAAADAQPPNTQDRKDLADFYAARGRAAAKIGRVSQHIEDLRRAAEYAKGIDPKEVRAIESELATAELQGGNLLNAIRLREAHTETGELGGGQVVANAVLAFMYTTVGDLPAAHGALKKAEEILGSLRSARGWPLFQYNWTAQVDRARGEVALAEGRFAEAEDAFRKALTAWTADFSRNELRRSRGVGGVLAAEFHMRIREVYQRRLALALMRQSRFAEAELMSREALQSGLKRVGRYSMESGSGIAQLSGILFQQGRYRESAILAREAVDILEKAGATPESQFIIGARRSLGSIFAVQGKWAEADTEFQKMRAGLERDPLLLQKLGGGDVAWALSLSRLGQADKAIEMLSRMLDRFRQRYGESSYETGEVRGFLGVAHAATGQNEMALKEFGLAVPLLLNQAATAGGGDAAGAVRQWRLIQILEGYIGVLVETVRAGRQAPGIDALAESFRLADMARGGRVQRALASSAARSAISDPQLAELARKEQDAEQRIGALNDLLTNMLGAPPAQQIPKVIEELRKEIAELRKERTQAKAEIEKRFPDYANLIDPKPPTVEQTRTAMREGEALISLYVGANQTFVWAIPKSGSPAVAVARLGDAEITQRVTRLRKALDAGASTIDDIPKFDVALAHGLFSDLLKPTESGWGHAKSLLIVPHLALGQLPFGLLPTAAATLPAKEAVQFEGYRPVPWLIRHAAITQLPSVNTLITLRRTPPGNPNRRAFAGFGDPFFSKKQAAEAHGAIQVAANTVGTRGAPIKLRSAPKFDGVASAELAQLPRLPDTREEILEIAKVMNADATQDVFLGERASVKTVKSMPLNNRKVIHFATHGLIPGELDGLTQPALALSSPDVAGPDNGDGLLKMDDILGLKLNADWVVLSACNTASGDGSGGTEAVSGLGRAFFFAGARALLVSNWPVDSVSARKLMTDLFRRQATDASLDRAEALRQAMVGLIDGEGEHDPATKKPLYLYAHPLFWAPFALVGDGGGR